MIKKFSYKLMLAIMALMVGTAANATVKLSVKPATAVTPGSEVQFAVIVDSEQDLSSVSFDVKFPKGITGDKAEKVNDRAKGKGWTLNFTEAPGLPGYFRFGLTYISFSPEDAKYILKGKGSIATIFAQTGDNVDNGPIELTNVQILDVDNNVVTDFEVEASEVSDAEVYPGTMNFSALTPSVNVYPGKVFPIEIALENDVALRAFQCHFSLPEGFEIVRNEDGDKFTLSDRNPDAASYNVNYNVNINDDILSLFIGATDEIEAGSGLLFSFLVKAPEQMPETAEFSLKNFFGGSIKGQGAGYNFDTEVVVTINNQLILDYEAAKAAVEDLQKAFDDAKAGIEEKFLDDLEEDINDIENDINGEQGLKAIANPEELNPDFSLVDFQQAVADELEKIQALADKAADMKEKNDQHNTDLNGQIEDLQKALDAVKEKVDAFDPVPDAFDKEAKAIQDAIDDLTKAVKTAFDEGDLVDKTELPENTVAADTKNLDNYAEAAKAADDLQAALDQAKEDMEDKFLDDLQKDIDAIQNAVNELEAVAKPEELDDNFDKESFDKAADLVQKAIDKLNADAAEMKKTNDQENADLTALIDPEIPNRFNEAKQNIKTANADVAPEFFESQEEGVPSRVDEIQEMIDDLFESLKNDFDEGDLIYEDPVKDIKDKKDAILDAIKQLEADAAAAQTKYKDNENGFKVLKKELETLKDELKEAKEAIKEECPDVAGDFDDEIAEIEDEIQALEDYLNERNGNRELDLSSTLDAPDQTVKDVLSDIAALVDAAEDAQAAEDILDAVAAQGLADLQGQHDAAVEMANENEIPSEEYADEHEAADKALAELADFIDKNDGNFRDEKIADQLSELFETADDAVDALTDKVGELVAAKQVIAGDINKDGVVDLSDLAILINALKNDVDNNLIPTKASEDFAYYDANEDGKITVADAQAIYNVYVAADEEPAAGARQDMTTGSLTATATKLENGLTRISVVLDSDASFTGYQMDIVLGKGMSVATERTDNDAELNSADLVNGTHRVIVFNPESANVASGEILTIDVMGEGNVSFDNVFFTDGAAHSYSFAVNGETTGISRLSTVSGSDIFDLGGRQLQSVKKGINILRSADGSAKKVIVK